MINVTFLILCVIGGFIQIPFPYYDKSRILVHTVFNLRNTEKPLFKCLWCKNLYYSFKNVYWAVSFFREREDDGEDDPILDIETSESAQLTSGKAIKASDAKKKAGRPAEPKNEATRSWTDDEINVLIEA